MESVEANLYGGNVSCLGIIIKIIIKMNIDNQKISGISGYFCAPTELKSRPDQSTKVIDFPSWATDSMSAYCFHQI